MAQPQAQAVGWDSVYTEVADLSHAVAGNQMSPEKEENHQSHFVSAAECRCAEVG